MYNKVALAFIRLIQILFRINFKYVIAHLEANGLHLWCYLLAWFLDIAESLVCFAVEFRKSFLPLGSDLLEYVWRNWKLWASSINDSWITRLLSWLLNCFGSIGHALSFECPCSKPVREILERLKTFSSTNNLRWVISTKECIWCLTHFLRGYTKTNHCVINDAIVLKRP